MSRDHTKMMVPFEADGTIMTVKGDYWPPEFATYHDDGTPSEFLITSVTIKHRGSFLTFDITHFLEEIGISETLADLAKDRLDQNFRQMARQERD